MLRKKPSTTDAAMLLLAVILLGGGYVLGATRTLPAHLAYLPVAALAALVPLRAGWSWFRAARGAVARSKAIVERAADSIITADESGVIRSVNPAAERVFGYRAAELIGHDITVLLSSIYTDHEDDDLWAFLRENAIGATGTAQEVIGLRRSGDRFFMELSISASKVGENMMFIAIVRDNTSKKLAEIALTQARDDLERRVEERTADLVTTNVKLRDEIGHRRKIQQEQARTLEELRQAMAEIKTLSGFIPICASCKKVRNDDGYWDQIETYISERSDAMFSHGICPPCRKELYPELETSEADPPQD